MPPRMRARPYEVMFFMVMRDGPAYGYELATRFRKMTGGHIRVSYGTIYPFLRKMERRGLIRSRRDRKSRRVYYELTARGVSAQRRHFRRMKENRRDMEERLLGILSMHEAIFGQRALNSLLARIK
jgi:DNA-binding PadR family transcriptional regulator